MSTRAGKDRDDYYDQAWKREAEQAKFNDGKRQNPSDLHRYYDAGNNSCIEYKGVHFTEVFTGDIDALKTHYELKDGQKFYNLPFLLDMIDSNKL